MVGLCNDDLLRSEKRRRWTPDRLAIFCESGVSSAQVKQILNDPKKLQEEMALVQRNLVALQKAEQSMRNPYKRQQVPGKRPKFRRTPRSDVRV